MTVILRKYSLPKNKQSKKKNKRKKSAKKNGNLDGFIVPDDNDDDDEDLYSPQPAAINKEEKDDEEDEDEDNDDMDIVQDEKKENEPQKKVDQSAAHWFDFNDEDISAVFDDEIDDLYDGGDAECPYMVIYRRKCMNRGNWPPVIPQFVSDLLIDEPLDAEEDKQQIDVVPVKLAMATKLVPEQREFISDSDTNSSNESNQDIDIAMDNAVKSKSSIPNSAEIIVISDDDSDSDNSLICRTPTASPKKIKYSK